MDGGNPLRLIDLLTEHNVPAVVIGGHAVTFHGYVRATEDTDVVFLRTAASEEALYDALRQVNACWISNEIDSETGLERAVPVSLEYIRATRLMMLFTDVGFLDVFDFIPGHPNQDVGVLFDSAVVSGTRQFVSLDWLRKMKRVSGRPKDRLDLENLPLG